MKHRTFFMTLLLFLLAVHAGILLIAIQTYRGMVEQMRTGAASEHYFIASGLLRDIATLDSRGMDYRQGVSGLAEPYGYLAVNQNSGISLYDGDTIVYSNIRAQSQVPTSAPPAGDRRIILDEQDGGAFILVIGKLPAPYSNYTIHYRSDVSGALREWRRMRNTMFGTGLALSGILAIGLLLLLGKLFRPLRDISGTSSRIAGGEYATRLAIKGSDEIAEMAASFNHMTDEIERQMEILTAEAENKQIFIDNFAHELKTPLTAIYGYAEYMQKADLSEDDRQFALECILSQSDRMQTMAYQMMELAGLRGGQIRIERIDPVELFQKVKQDMTPCAAEKGVPLRFFCDLTELRGDAALLESLLANLIDNAIKASGEGSPVTVRAFLAAGVPAITVEDKGKGIPPEALSRLTQPYYRVEKHRNRRDGGAGLGLAICEQIAAKHGAKISFSSNPGNGTTVTITFTTP